MNATREAMATIRLDATRRPRRRTRQERREYHNKTHLATMIIITGASIAATTVHRNKEEDISRQEASSRLGKIQPLISYDASVGIDKTDQQKQAAKTAQPP